jgi:hypothetical protein
MSHEANKRPVAETKAPLSLGSYQEKARVFSILPELSTFATWSKYPNIVTCLTIKGGCFVLYDSHFYSTSSLEPAINKYINSVARIIEGALTMIVSGFREPRCSGGVSYLS